METAVKKGCLTVVNEVQSLPEIIGLTPAEETIVFFGRLADKEYCVITVGSLQCAAFRQSSAQFGKDDLIKAMMYYGDNSSLTPYPVSCGYKITRDNSSSRWFCRAKADNLEEKEINVILRDGDFFFNGRPFQKIFLTF